MKVVQGPLLMAFAVLLVAGCKITPGPKDPAPTFTATLDSGQKVDSATLMGDKGMVLYFYPKDETPGCIKQACKFQDKLQEFQSKGFKVVGVSVDTGESHQAFKNSRKLDFTLVSDTDKSIAKVFNVPTEPDPVGSVGFRRTTFVVAKSGIIINRFEVPDPEKQVDLALEAIREPF